MAVVSLNLLFKAGTLNLPGKSVPFWGFATSEFNTPQCPGPVINAVVGDTIRIRLLDSPSSIKESVSIIFPGQEDVRARKLPGGAFGYVQPQYSDGKMVSLTDFLDPNVNSGIEYRFRVGRPGIFIYEGGTNSEKQVQMGLYGIIIIRPRGYDTSFHPNYKTAYGANTDSGYDVEKLLVLGEIDSIMHQSVAENIYYDMLKFKPDYWVINSRCFPDTLNTNDSSSQPYGSVIHCRPGQRVLLRIVNAGFQVHTFYFGGLYGRVVASDSYPLRNPGLDSTYEKTGITIGAGQSHDIIVVPQQTGEFFLYDREYNHLVNNDEFPGGMMTRMIVQP